MSTDVPTVLVEPLTEVRGHRFERARAWARSKNVSGKIIAVLSVLAIASGIATYFLVLPPGETGGDRVEAEIALAVLVLDLVLLLLLAGSVSAQLVRVWSQRRRGAAGSLLHMRLVTLFSIVAIAPTILVAVLSALFLNYEMRAWFSNQVRAIVDNSFAISETYIQEHRTAITDEITAMAGDVSRELPFFRGDSNSLNNFVRAQATLRRFPEAIVFEGSGRVLAMEPVGLRSGPSIPTPRDIARARDAGTVIVLTTVDNRVRAIVKLEGSADLFLYASRLVDPEVVAYLERSQGIVTGYRAMEGKRSEIQIALVSIYILVALVLLLAAIGVGLSLANRLARPIGELIDAAERVGVGDLAVRVPELNKRDELGTLMRAFNEMTGRLESQQREVLEANRQLDVRRRFTEAVLAGVSAGVIGLDGDGRINLPNRAAAEFLGLSQTDLVGREFVVLMPEASPVLGAARRTPDRIVDSQIEIQRDGRARNLLVRVAAEQGGDGADIKGFVVTFDDVTELMLAQRKSAWADIARRIAHEIRNPLTPIQLSAERLKRRYLPQVTDDPETFAECTDTIVRQVADIDRMVEEFSDFARMPAPVLQDEDMGALCRQALMLQRTAYPDVAYSFDAPDAALLLHCDRRQIGQALTNVLKNAAEAIAARREDEPNMTNGEISVRLSRRGGDCVVDVEDNGCGLPDGDVARLTEPYVTRREKGTGLGLAIVKKIMEDHHGALTLSTRAEGGAKVSLIFTDGARHPVTGAQRMVARGA